MKTKKYIYSSYINECIIARDMAITEKQAKELLKNMKKSYEENEGSDYNYKYEEKTADKGNYIITVYSFSNCALSETIIQKLECKPGYHFK